MNGKRIAGYSRSDDEGRFSIKISGEQPDTLEIVADCIGYEQTRLLLPKGTDHADLKMKESSVTLREVTVEAPKVSQRGDTVSYRLGAFTGKSDLTLEDGLKRLPGVEVAETGKISYLGKEISDFYVENLQLAGSNYGLVTKNMPAEYVTDVELIENHQSAAMDKGKMSDNVAMNVKLSNKAKFRPVGSTEVMAGAQPRRFVYRVGGTGMMFSPKFQAMLNLKAGNYGQENFYFKSQRLPDYARSAIGQLTGATPPLRKDYYTNIDDLSTSLNFIRAFSQSKTLRVNLGYSYESSRNHYSNTSIYATDQGTIEFAESGDPSGKSHQPYIDLYFNQNDPNKFVSNSLAAKGDITENDFPVASNGENYSQFQKLKTLLISDDFGWRKKYGSKIYSFHTDLSFIISPTAMWDVESPGTFNAHQSASSHTLEWKASTSFSWNRKQSIWTLPIDVNLSTSRLQSELDYNPDFSNNIASTEANVSFAPRYELTTRRRLIELSISVPVKLQFLHARNRRSEAKADLERVLLNPNLRLVINPSSRFSLSLNGGINHSTGDLLDLLTNQIMTDFRNIKTASGIIGKTKTASATVKAEYKNAIEMLFADASAGYSQSSRNTINSLYIESGEIENGTIFFNNNSDNFTGSAMISKQFSRQGIFMSMRGVYNWTKSHSIQQGELITSYAKSFSISPRITINPLRFFELRYNGSIGKSFTRFQKSRSGIFSMNNDIGLSIYPANGWDIFGDTSILRKELSDGSYKNFSLFNAGVRWKFKKYNLTLKADNLLNTRHYSYSIFNGINVYSYDFLLTGRTIYLKWTMTL